jgi:transposase
MDKYRVNLTQEERAELEGLLGKGKAAARKLAHARVLLQADASEGGPGWTDAAIAGALDVHPGTVARVRREYVTAGLDGTLERKTPDRLDPRRLDGAQEAHLVALACSAPPAGRERWTLRLLATELVRLEVVETVSYETVRRTLKQTGSSRG